MHIKKGKEVEDNKKSEKILFIQKSPLFVVDYPI